MHAENDEGQRPFTSDSSPSPFSVDDQGRALRFGGEIYRRVSPEFFDLHSALATDGRLDRLIEAGLVRTWTDSSAGEYMLRHETIPFVTFPQEWTVGMLQRAALRTLDVALALNAIGLSLMDAHAWNVSFHRGHAVYLDYSSIRRERELRPIWIREFFTSFYVPLWLRSRRLGQRYYRVVANMVHQSEHTWADPNNPRAIWRRLFLPNRLGRFCRRFWRIERAHRDPDPRVLLEALRRHVASLSFARHRTQWAEYKDPGGAFDDLGSFSAKARAVHTLLRGIAPGRLIDIACNRGWFTGLAQSMGHTAFGVDVDENAIEAAHYERRPAAWKVDLAVMNVLWPTPPQGRCGWLPSALDRWQAETVLMIALEHHLVLKQRCRFEALAAIADRLGAKNLIIEWIPSDDVYVRHWRTPEWYCEDNFVRSIAKTFPRFRCVPSGAGHEDFPGPTTRVMYLFQK